MCGCALKASLASLGAAPPGIADRVWTIGDLLDAALAVAPTEPTETAPDQRQQFRVIQGDRASAWSYPLRSILP
jgi:hypothetical protein